MVFYLGFGKEICGAKLKKSAYYSNKTSKTPPKLSNLGSILQNSIMTSVTTIIMIGGFVMLFSIIISIIENIGIFDIFTKIFSPLLNIINIPDTFIKGILSGIVELTNGISIVSSIPMKAISINIIICAFLLGFGGISVLLQVLSITSTSDISIKPYIIGKVMQGLFAAFYTYIFLQNFVFLHLDI